VESRNVQGTALMKLVFHPGTNMAQAMAETINYVNRSRAMMPPGTVPPFVMRFDTGSVPVGYLVLSSGTTHDRRDSGSGVVSRAADVFIAAWRICSAAFRRFGSQCCDLRESLSDCVRTASSPDEIVSGTDSRQHHCSFGQRAEWVICIRQCRPMP
jgi:hypothetical protein